MQRNEKTAPTILDIISTEYFNPLIEALKASLLDEALIIKAMMRALQGKHATIRHPMFYNITELAFIHDFDNARLTSDIKDPLMLHPDLKIQFTRLGALYLDQTVQAQVFPDVHIAEIHACIRELFHVYLNPLKAFQFNHLTLPQTQLEASTENNGFLFSTPRDVQRLIYSYLNVTGIFSLKETCRSGYRLSKENQNKNENIFYAVGDEVRISHNDLFRVVIRSDVSDHEIVNSLYEPRLKEVKIFRSLYGAIEFAHTKFHHGRGRSRNVGFIPSLWVVSYVGNLSDLEFKQESFEINSGDGTLAYSRCHRDMHICSASVPKKSIQPLLGTVVMAQDDFADYQQSVTVDFAQYMRNKQREEEELSEKKKCAS